MKFAVVILAFVAAASAQFKAGAYNTNPYNPFANQNNRNSQYNRQFYKPSTPSPYRTYAPIAYPSSTAAPLPVVPIPVPSARYQGDARSAQILKYGNEVNPDGSYAYFYETDNGIAAQEQGTPRNLGGNPPVIANVVQGSYSFVAPNGEPISISYVADENGYQPSGNAIPTPPPVPAQIARALAYIARQGQQKK